MNKQTAKNLVWVGLTLILGYVIAYIHVQAMGG